MKNQDNKLNASIIKSTINPYDFYIREQNISRFSNKSGQWATGGLCPFHPDNKQGSFKVNLMTGAFRCWSCGASGGDIIAFIQKRESLEFIETLKHLCYEWRLS